MNQIMPLPGAHPAPGEEVMAMDDVEVDVVVCRVSINSTSDLRERGSGYTLTDEGGVSPPPSVNTLRLPERMSENE